MKYRVHEIRRVMKGIGGGVEDIEDIEDIHIPDGEIVFPEETDIIDHGVREDYPYYINIFIDENETPEYVFKTGNEHADRDDTDNIEGLKKLLRHGEAIEDVFLAEKVPIENGYYYRPITDNRPITSNMNLYFELRSELLYHIIETYDIDASNLGSQSFDFINFFQEYSQENKNIFISILRTKLPFIFKMFQSSEEVIVRNFNDEMFFEMMRYLKFCDLSNIKYLYLAYNGKRGSRISTNSLTDQHVTEICHVLSNTPNLQRLTMIGMECTTSQVDKLVCSLRTNNSSLRQLILSQCNITDESIKTISTLVNESLPYGDYGTYCGKRLPKELIRKIDQDRKELNINLIDLDVSSNEITDAGLRYIAEALYGNDSLEILNLDGNKITESGLSLLRDKLKKRLELRNKPTSLRRLHLFENEIEIDDGNILRLIDEIENLSLTPLQKQNGVPPPFFVLLEED